jgi:hypothetical protein
VTSDDFVVSAVRDEQIGSTWPDVIEATGRRRVAAGETKYVLLQSG